MASITTFTDNFTGTSIDGAKWTNTSFNGATVTQSDKLICTPLASTSNTGAELDSINSFDLTGVSATVQVLQIVGLGGATFFYLFIDGNNKVFFQCDGTPKTLQAHKVVASVQTQLASITYSSTTMAWWRIRETSGITYWEYSADGKSWTELTHDNNSITLTALKVGLEGYDFTSETGQGAAWFDNLDLPTPIGKSTISGQAVKRSATY